MRRRQLCPDPPQPAGTPHSVRRHNQPGDLICELELPSISLAGLDKPANEAALTLIKHGLLAEAVRERHVVCPGCDDPHMVNVFAAPAGGLRAYCASTGWHAIEPTDAVRYDVNLTAVAHHICRHFGTSPREPSTVRSEVRDLGLCRLGSYRARLFFARRLGDDRQSAPAMATVDQLRGNDAAVLVTSTDPGALAGPLPPRTATVALTEVVQIGAAVRVDEAPLLSALRQSPAWKGPLGFRHSVGFRTVIWNEAEFAFSATQAEIVECLHAAWFNGSKRVHGQELAGITSQRMTELFRRHTAYGTLIRHDEGFFWLDL